MYLCWFCEETKLMFEEWDQIYLIQGKLFKNSFNINQGEILCI